MLSLPFMRAAADSILNIQAAEAGPLKLECLEGRVPEGLSGSLLRNGPGRTERGGVRYGHPFDGDGFLTRVDFNHGEVTWQGRWVRTREWQAEEAAGRILYRAFGTNRPGGLLPNLLRMRFKNAANTHVVQHAGRTLALWEGGWPHLIDLDSLETLGRVHLDGALRNAGPDALFNPELPFAAHPKLDPETGELWSFGIAYGITNRLMLWIVGPDGQLRERRCVPLTGLPFVHDFVLTRDWAVFVLPAVRFQIGRALLGLSAPVQAMSLDQRPGTVLLVPRAGGPAVRIPAPPGFIFHWIHGWDDDGRVILDGVKYADFPTFDDITALFTPGRAGEAIAQAVRLTVDPASGTCEEMLLADHPIELPQTTAALGEPWQVAWASGAPPERRHPFLSCTLRLEREQGVTHCRDFGDAVTGEPMPIPAPGGAEWVVQTLHRERSTELLVLRASDLATEARLQLPTPLPPRLHGTWLPREDATGH